MTEKLAYMMPLISFIGEFISMSNHSKSKCSSLLLDKHLELLEIIAVTISLDDNFHAETSGGGIMRTMRHSLLAMSPIVP